MRLTDEEFWDLTLPEFNALNNRRIQAQKEYLTGFQFLATVFARHLTGNKDITYMEESAPTKLISLDSMEVHFKAMAEGGRGA